jgi:hypothetical protein
LVVRNGLAEPSSVLASAEAIEVQAPGVNDKRIDEATGGRKRFASASLPARCHRSPKISGVLLLPYLHVGAALLVALRRPPTRAGCHTPAAKSPRPEQR